MAADINLTFQVNFKYIAQNGKLRSAACCVDAKNATEARKKAVEIIKADHDKFQLTTVKTWGQQTI